MKKNISLPTVIVAVVLTAFIAFSVSFSVTGNMYNDTLKKIVQSYEQSESVNKTENNVSADIQLNSDNFVMETEKRLKEIDEQVRSTYIGEIDNQKLSDYIMQGYVAGVGDKHAAFIPQSEYAAYTGENEGHSVGIGINVIYDSAIGGIYIINVNQDGPAEKAGLLPSDIITAIDGEKVSDIGYYGTISRIKAGKIGESFTATIAHAPDYSTVEDVVIVRDTINIVTVKGKMMENNIALIEISEFNRATSMEFIRIIQDLKKQGAKKYIFDMRNNPGGDLLGISEVLDYLLPKGPIIRIINKQGEVSALESDRNELKAPMVVITNENTASAAELFTSALRDYEKATIVGTTTYGKGTMQSVFPLKTGGAVSISTNMYNPPFSDNYDGVGIIPDVEIEMPEDLAKRYYKLTDEEDNQLMKALELIREMK